MKTRTPPRTATPRPPRLFDPESPAGLLGALRLLAQSPLPSDHWHVRNLLTSTGDGSSLDDLRVAVLSAQSALRKFNAAFCSSSILKPSTEY